MSPTKDVKMEVDEGRPDESRRVVAKEEATPDEEDAVEY